MNRYRMHIPKETIIYPEVGQTWRHNFSRRKDFTIKNSYFMHTPAEDGNFDRKLMWETVVGGGLSDTYIRRYCTRVK